MKISKFEEFPIWKISLKITKEVYDLTSEEKFSKDWALRDQIRRAIVSVSSNIVEGFEKNNNNEFVRYLKIAKGSVGEVRNQLYIAHSVNYCSDSCFSRLNQELIELGSQIGAFISYLQKKKKLGEFVIR